MVIWFYPLSSPVPLTLSVYPAAPSLCLHHGCLMIELWPLEWLYTDLHLPSMLPRPLSLPVHYHARMPSLSLPLSCHLGSKGKNEERDKRKENKHWAHGRFFACNICMSKSMRCGRNGEVFLLLISGMENSRAMSSEFLNSSRVTVSLCSLSLIFFLALNIGLDFGSYLNDALCNRCNKFSKPYSLEIKFS